MKKEAVLCKCGSYVSDFEQREYGKCTDCHEKDKIEKKELEKKKKEEEKRKKEENLQQQRKNREEMLKQIVGKTIADVKIDNWASEEPIKEEALSMTITFSDGSELELMQGEVSEGAMGHYDYYQYLDFDINKLGD